MITIKSYTDIGQSKKLAEILPVESADMCFNTHNNMPPLMTPYSRFKEFYDMEPTPDFLIPCWGLSALLNVIPQVKLDNAKNYDKKHWRCCAYYASDWHTSDWYDNSIDACYEIIVKLNELKML